MSAHIIRVACASDVVTVARSTALDRSLSFQARGMLLALLALGDGAETSPEALTEESPAGRDAIYSILAELRAAGYVDRQPERAGGRIVRWVTLVRETPDVASPHAAAPDQAAPDQAKPEVVSTSVGYYPTSPDQVMPEVAPLSPPMAPPLVSPSLPPTPPNQTPSDPPPLSPPTPKAKTEPKGAVSDATAGRDERAIRWRPFYAAVSEGFGGLRVVNARTGAALAWVGQLAAIAGKATDDDPAAASSLWREFTEDPRFEFAGNGGDTTVAAFGKWVRMRSAAERRVAAKEEPQWLTN